MKHLYLILLAIISASCSPIPLPSTQEASETPSATETLAPTATSTPIPLVTVKGKVFQDLNGDGISQSDEPLLPEVNVAISDRSGITGADGSYSIENVPIGTWNIIPTIDQFPFISLSSEAYVSSSIGQSIYVTNDETQVDIGLMQGVFTLPFSSNDSFYIYSWMDLDPSGGVRRYDGSTDACGWITWPSEPIIGTCDTHNGVDFIAKQGTSILAVAPGKVFYVATPTDQVHECLNVFLLHEINGDYYLSQYGHNSANLVNEGQFVKRGEPVALVGHSCTELDHLHFALLQVPPSVVKAVDGNQKRGIINDALAIDPFRDVTNALSKSLWTKENDPQYSQ